METGFTDNPISKRPKTNVHELLYSNIKYISEAFYNCIYRKKLKISPCCDINILSREKKNGIDTMILGLESSRFLLDPVSGKQVVDTLKENSKVYVELPTCMPQVTKDIIENYKHRLEKVSIEKISEKNDDKVELIFKADHIHKSQFLIDPPDYLKVPEEDKECYYVLSLFKRE